MGSIMVIRNRNGTKTLHMCPCWNLQVPDSIAVKDETIPIFYSEKHAYDEGWKLTSDIKFCPSGVREQWVMPRLCKKIYLEKGVGEKELKAGTLPTGKE